MLGVSLLGKAMKMREDGVENLKEDEQKNNYPLKLSAAILLLKTSHRMF